MMPSLSPNTQAILLLTAPLIAGHASEPEEFLKPGEYKRLARHLRELQRQPADLVSPDAEGILRACHSVIEETRLRRLLQRGFLLAQAIERWQARAIWVISRADAAYPRRWKARLKEDTPAVLYGCGDVGLLEGGGLTVVGPRHADRALIGHAMSVGRLAARAGRMLVSGGAMGIAQAAMRGALESGGRACGVLADSLERTVLNWENRNPLLEGRLTLISSCDPSVGFNVGHAMQRNKLIHALADASLVVDSDDGKGGTWAGAVEQLDKLKFVPIYVRSTGAPSAGLDALRGKGALAWPDPQDADAFEALFRVTPRQAEFTRIAGNTGGTESGSAVLPFHEAVVVSRPEEAPAAEGRDPPVAEFPRSVHPTPAETLFAVARDLIRQGLIVPGKEEEMAAALEISPIQLKAWLDRLVEEGVLERQGSGHYVATPQARPC